MYAAVKAVKGAADNAKKMLTGEAGGTGKVLEEYYQFDKGLVWEVEA